MLGETVSVLVALSWTLCALFFEYAGKRIGSTNLNLVRLLFAFVMLGVTLFIMGGSFFPRFADIRTWGWMGLSGMVGFVLGDYFLFYSYTLITARFSQLIMTLAPPFAALSGWVLLEERLSFPAILGMAVTLAGIAISIYSKGSAESAENPESGTGSGTGHLRLALPLKGVIFAVIGAFGQGVGIVLSKEGMMAYQEALNVSAGVAGEAASTAAGNPLYVPFAATQMRIITGIFIYIGLIAFTAGLKQFFRAWKNIKGIRAALYGSVFGPFLGVSLSLMAVRYTNSAVASTIMATVPILILIPDKFIFKRQVTPRQVLGAVISVAGVAMFFIKF